MALVLIVLGTIYLAHRVTAKRDAKRALAARRAAAQAGIPASEQPLPAYQPPRRAQPNMFAGFDAYGLDDEDEQREGRESGEWDEKRLLAAHEGREIHGGSPPQYDEVMRDGETAGRKKRRTSRLFSLRGKRGGRNGEAEKGGLAR